tara:strand:+ start:560 stop:922 length:363 start_codon:yes stop_codon:yes gene_type:complete
MNLINVSDVVNSFNQQVIQVQSFGTGIRIKGRYKPVEEPIRSIFASVQHPSPDSLKGLPEGLKTNRNISVISTETLRGVKEFAEAIADIITWQGQKYRVYQVLPWNQNGYNEAIATELKE